MSDNKAIGFDDLPESKQSKSINGAGIHRGFLWVNAEFQPKAKKKEKVKQKDGTEKEVETDKTIGPYAKFTFKSLDGETTFVTTMFAPPTTDEEVKFLGDKYEGGIAVRKNTPEEQIRQEFTRRFYFYEQLAKALTISPDKFLVYKKGVKADVDVLFKEMFDQFIKQFPVAKHDKKPVDLKVLWNNNNKAKTSFLQLADAGANNVVIAQHIPERDTLLTITQWEQKKLVRKFNNDDRAPQDNSTEVGSNNAWKPTANADAFDNTDEGGSEDSDDLF